MKIILKVKEIDEMKCSICGRTLDCEDDPFSEDCGGDCLKCVAETGDPEAVEALFRIKELGS